MNSPKFAHGRIEPEDIRDWFKNTDVGRKALLRTSLKVDGVGQEALSVDHIIPRANKDHGAHGRRSLGGISHPYNYFMTTVAENSFWSNKMAQPGQDGKVHDKTKWIGDLAQSMACKFADYVTKRNEGDFNYFSFDKQGENIRVEILHDNSGKRKSASDDGITGSSLIADLRELKQLHTEGALTDEEFAQSKAKIL